jgi:hypothetical protein
VVGKVNDVSTGPLPPLPQSAVEDVRLCVYRSFRSAGRAPDAEQLADACHLGVHHVREALERLHASRDIVLDADHDTVVMAHPFSSVPLGFVVMGERTLWWGGCAWDSFAIAHLLVDEPDVLVATRCPACSKPHAWVVGRDEPPAGDQLAHFLTPVAQIWDDVVRACRHQQIFCDLSCLTSWLSRHGYREGYPMDLATLWRLARGWYAGRLETGYVRREPTAAVAYFADVGLTGSFWGLPDLTTASVRSGPSPAR